MELSIGNTDTAHAATTASCRVIKVDSTYILYIYLQGHFVMIEVFSKFISLVIESEQTLKKW